MSDLKTEKEKKMNKQNQPANQNQINQLRLPSEIFEF